MSDYCTGVATDLVSRGHLGHPEWELRWRTAWPAPGALTPLGGPHRLTFNRGFLEQLDRWAGNMEYYGVHFPSRHGPKKIDFFGEVGSMACHRASAAHNRARGLDLCQIRYTDGSYVDMNASHRMSRLHQRRYLAVAANLRRFFGTVLTCHYNSAHRDHIHVDDLTAVAPIRTDKRSDTTLVQSAANLLGGERLAVDGAWGSKTEAAYQRLLGAFGLACADPKRSLGHARSFLSLVVCTAMADRDAGAYASRACAPTPCRDRDGVLGDVACAANRLLGG